MFPVANSAVNTILGNLDALYLSPQVVGEFWRVATSPVDERGGFGWSPQQTDRQMQALEYIYPMLHDGPLVYGKWRQIMQTITPQGVKICDAHLAATMLAHDVSHILTFNVKDFKRYEYFHIYAIHPRDVK